MGDGITDADPPADKADQVKQDKSLSLDKGQDGQATAKPVKDLSMDKVCPTSCRFVLLHSLLHMPIASCRQAPLQESRCLLIKDNNNTICDQIEGQSCQHGYILYA